MLSFVSIGDIEKLCPADSMTFYEVMEQMPEIESKIITDLTAQLEKII